MIPLRRLAISLLFTVLALTPVGAGAFDIEESLRQLHGQNQDQQYPEFRAAQSNGGKSLGDAIEQVRRQTDGRILSAETKVHGNREVHHIKVLTKDGKVKIHQVQGRKRGG